MAVTNMRYYSTRALDKTKETAQAGDTPANISIKLREREEGEKKKKNKKKNMQLTNNNKRAIRQSRNAERRTSREK